MIRSFLLALLTLVAAPLGAQTVADLPHTRVELTADTLHPAPAKPFTIAVVMTPKPGWHTYWVNPGDSGVAPRAAWRGVSAGPFRFPTPKPYVLAGLMNHVFDARAVLLADARLTGGLVSVRLDWLVCSEQLCVPEGADLGLPLTPGEGRPDPAGAAVVAAGQAALPKPLAGVTFARVGRQLQVAFPLSGGIRAVHLFPLADGAVAYAAPQTMDCAGRVTVVSADAFDANTPAGFDGVLRVERLDGAVAGYAFHAVRGVVPAALAVSSRGEGGAPGVLPAFALALLGGLLLNVMPCVFPILSLKALSLAKSGASAGAARGEALAYTAGVVGVVTALGGIAIALARAGGGAGWAAQLQDPRVIAALMLLTLAIGLNFAGLFEVDLAGKGAGQALASRPGRAGAFFTGGLAAFVATPCTGPFMAGALGAALVLPPLAGLAVFAGLGLGLALPFLAVGFVPWLRRHLPRPGAWMAVFRRWLSVPMFATALGLAWVLGRQAGVDGLTAALAGALGLALLLWWLGAAQMRGGGSRWAALGLAAVLAVAVPLALPVSASGPVAADAGPLAAQPWSPARLASLQAARTPTFVYFTADWCLTCKVNERGALSSAAVARAFRQRRVRVLVGDWTRPDPAIAAFLSSRGRAGIPLYLFYRADGTVDELPQLLTERRLLALA